MYIRHWLAALRFEWQFYYFLQIVKFICLTDSLSDYSIQAQALNRAVILALVNPQTRASFFVELITGAYLQSHLRFEPRPSNW